MSYCKAMHIMKPDDLAVHKPYHDHHYGFPIHDDNALSEVRLIWKKDEDPIINSCADAIHAYYNAKQMNF